MSSSSSSRADASRNRENLILVATRVFTSEVEPSMRAIAREANVGIGTLYRHFPTRELLVQAVYKDSLERLESGAKSLIETHRPAEAMREWMNLFAGWIATKHGMTQTVRAMIASGDIGYAESRAKLLNAITVFLDAGKIVGDIRSDICAEDIAASLMGIFIVAGNREQAAQANRLLDLLMDGLRTRDSKQSAKLNDERK
ncbi:MAG: TetR/AcrR family transcriptional regulator [Candidatus Obscuribacterales bacterium]|nr:TetR/AcrR family transcriptional regulator [Candidatus Obscuribacterales bacterium]